MNAKETNNTNWITIEKRNIVVLTISDSNSQIFFFFFGEPEMKDHKTTQTYEGREQVLSLSPTLSGKTQTNPKD